MTIGHDAAERSLPDTRLCGPGEDKQLVCFGSKPMRQLGGRSGRQSIAENQNIR
jgi:hypothetical protein